MAHDRIASDIAHWIHEDLRHGDRVDRWYGEGLDWHVLDVLAETPSQLDVWLENGQTGEKVKYHVAVEKAAIQPQGDVVLHEDIDSEYGSDRYTIIRGGKKLVGTIIWEKRDGTVSIQRDEIFNPEGEPYNEEQVTVAIGMIWACYNANIGVIAEKDLCIGVGPNQIRLTDEVWMDLLAKAKEYEPED